ncbi:MAG: acetolactate synthase large subunit [Pseudomonadaceae bacterium]|nr:acetolactate synthase large subunit [Pseudomonadaceae bacterium]
MSKEDSSSANSGAANGATRMLQTLVDAGVDTCFTNPGTSEMHFVAAIDQQQGMRSILGLFEGVVTGAADGYARMADKPACTLLHLGPGLANGLANLHNARRAHTPVINLVGEHATYHRELDAPLTADINGFAEPVSGWIKTCNSADELAGAAADAVTASLQPPGQIASLILPADTAWTDTQVTAEPNPLPVRTSVTDAQIEGVAAVLRSGEPCVFLLGDIATREQALDTLGKISEHCGATLLGDTFLSRQSRGAGRVPLDRLPYFAEQAIEVLAPFKHLILVGTKAPVSFFAYPGVPSTLAGQDTQIHSLAGVGDDIHGALDGLAQALGADKLAPPRAELALPGLPSGSLDLAAIGAAVATLLPENAIVMNEAATSGFAIPGPTATAAPHEWLDLTGGAIGMGIPAATGAAVACPDRKVVCLQADGSGMYTLQGLWTQAREGLDVTTVIFANRKYAILQVELMRVGVGNPGPKAFDMLDLSRPDLQWVSLAQGMGVPAEQATSADEFVAALRRGLETPGPYLVEVLL